MECLDGAVLTSQCHQALSRESKNHSPDNLRIPEGKDALTVAWWV
jgi:hypothetical protein